MSDPLRKSPARTPRRILARWAALAVGAVLPTVGCQVEYAGMTLPSGKYMHDDVQYFPPGPDFPWANTQAATQRARMQAMGLDITAPPAEGGGAVALPPGVGGPGGPGVAPMPGGAAPGGIVPPPPAPGNGVDPAGGLPADAPGLAKDPQGGIPTPDAPGTAKDPSGGIPVPRN